MAISITDVNEQPSVSLNNTITTLAEDTDTSSRIKVADIVVNDDALGTNDLTLSGADASLFEINGMELYLKDGTFLDFETNPVLDLKVQVDDTSVGATPDDAAPLSINVTDSSTVITAGQSFNVSETAANGTAVGSVAITGDEPTGFNITAGDPDSAFAIDASGYI